MWLILLPKNVAREDTDGVPLSLSSSPSQKTVGISAYFRFVLTCVRVMLMTLTGAGSFAEVKSGEEHVTRVADLLNLDAEELTFVLQSYTTEVGVHLTSSVAPFD